jgi:hypothetical protein
MKTRTFLTGIAALLMATSAAHATVALPEAMLGDWCQDESKSIDNRAVYFRAKECPNPEEDITVRRATDDEGRVQVEIGKDSDTLWLTFNKQTSVLVRTSLACQTMTY